MQELTRYAPSPSTRHLYEISKQVLARKVEDFPFARGIVNLYLATTVETISGDLMKNKYPSEFVDKVVHCLDTLMKEDEDIRGDVLIQTIEGW